MKKINKFKTKLITSFLTVFAFAVILSSCGDDPVTTTTTQTGGNATEVGTPNGPPLTVSIGTGGGSIMFPDSSIQLIVPAGALGSSTDITLQPITNFCHNGSGDAFRITPSGLTFSQPVTLKFRYDEAMLSGSHGALMGIARQDAGGLWRYMNSVSNDTVNRVISCDISSLSGSPGDNSGEGDWSIFDIVHIEPRFRDLRVNETLQLEVKYAWPDEVGELVPLPKPVDSWFANAVHNGNSQHGFLLNQNNQTVTYKAPAQVPSQNPVQISAVVPHSMHYNGQHIQAVQIGSLIKIQSDTMKYELKINMVIHDFLFGVIEYHCTYTDHVEMLLTVTGTFPRTVTVTQIVNSMPNVTPPSGTYPNGQGSITWQPRSDSGTINVTSVSGDINTFDYMSLGITHMHTSSAQFYCVPPLGDPYTIPSQKIPGAPGELVILANGTTQTITDPIHNITITLTPRN
jgi:hypothetical protein